MVIWHLTKTLKSGSGQYAARLSEAMSKTGSVNSFLLVADYASGGHKLRRCDRGLRKLAARAIRSASHRVAIAPFFTVKGVEQYDFDGVIQPGDIVHLHGPCNWIGISGLRKLIPDGVRVYQTVHGGSEFSGGCITLAGSVCDGFTEDCGHCPALKTSWNYLASLELRFKKDFVSTFKIRPIANGEWTRAQILKSALFRHVRDIPVIPPIVSSEYFACDGSKVRSELGIPSDDFVILLGARTLNDPYKGIIEFLDRIADISLGRKVTILLFGEGQISYDSRLDVRVFDWVNRPEDLAELYLASNVFVSPTRMETFGMTLIEAQATGTPVICFDVGGVRNALSPAMLGGLEELGNWNELFNVIEKFMIAWSSDKAISRDVLRDWTKGRFGAEALARAQLAIYENDVNFFV